MAKAAYVGIADKARRITDIYVGVNDTARKVKKAYVGVNGVARLFFKHMNNGKSDTTLTLSQARADLQGNSVGNYIIFAGGNNYGYERYPTSNAHIHYNTVDAFNENLVRSTSVLGYRKANLATARNANYAFFAGGETTSSNSSSKGTASASINAFDSSLVRSSPTNLSSSVYQCAGARVGVYAIFAGGHNGSSGSKKVDAYNNSLAKSTATDLTYDVALVSGVSVGNYALFGGGYTPGTSGGRNNVNAYNSSLVKSTPSNFYSSLSRRATATIGNYAVFVGGFRGYTSGSYTSAVVDFYSASNLTHTYVTNFPTKVDLNAGASIGKLGLFGGR